MASTTAACSVAAIEKAFLADAGNLGGGDTTGAY
jgi:hypothetical protein